ncbi:SAM-dependent methyltransferase [Sinosporangium siamense]|uniref:S-adenosyl methyltransferase n=1 Tax=Sinosporangium siamense TaxID=1367973 RepID=A0A919RMX1_9ACTN|nr:SAM-dependent methyltransferase [Sinosporangium siamense]GII94944.1 hypothetical protein Ssi02_51750 [Sinosporangium siamense]
MTGTPPTPPSGSEFDPTKPDIARTYRALQQWGKRDALPADRHAAAELMRKIPGADQVMQENKAVLVRMTRFAVRRGHTQFVDIGAGTPATYDARLPELPNLMEVAADIRPERRWVSVDVNPVVLAHLRVLDRDGVSTLEGDVRDLEGIFNDIEGQNLLDLGKPVVVVLGAVIHFIDDHEAAKVVPYLMRRLSPGSMVLFTHVTSTGRDPQMVAAGKAAYEALVAPIWVRSQEEIAVLLDGLTLHPPGLVRTIAWDPDETTDLASTEAPHFLAAAGDF